jgi:hypothetical protein
VRWMVLPAVLAAFMLALAGCGGSDSSDAGGGDDAVTTEEVVDDSTLTDAVEDDSTVTDAMEDETDASEDDGSGLDLSGSGLSDECQDLVAASAKYGEAYSALGGAGDVDVQGASAALSAVADAAPDEIKDAFQTLAEAIATYADALEGIDLTGGGTPDPETIAKITAAAQSIDNEAVAAASQEISDWTQENCSATP